MDSRKPIRLFISYSHKDEKLRIKLEEHLATLIRSGDIEIWNDRRISAGQQWAREIDERLDSSQIVLLLVSAAFISSDYCYGIELTRALEKHNSGEARVIPIILRSVDWSGTPFANLQALPRDAKPISNWRNTDEALAKVVSEIGKVCNEIQENFANDSSKLQRLNHRLIPLACRAIIFFLMERYMQEKRNYGYDVRFETYEATDFTRPMDSGVSLFLHRVRQDRALELDFILTAWGKSAQNQQMLAGWMMEQFERTPELPLGLMEYVSPEELTPLGITVSISSSKEDIHQIWKTITDVPFQISIPYVAGFKRIEGVKAEDEEFFAQLKKRWSSDLMP